MIFSLGFMNPRVLRGRSLSSRRPRRGSPPGRIGRCFGEVPGRSPLCLSLVPRCHGSAGRRSRRPCRSEALIRAAGRVPALVLVVRLLRRSLGRCCIFVDDGLLTCSRRARRAGRIVNLGGALDERADGALLRLVIDRPPVPGTARKSSISGVARDHGHGFAETALRPYLGVCGRFAPASWRVSALLEFAPACR